eukprot:5360709-Prymnesium_polylepis.1
MFREQSRFTPQPTRAPSGSVAEMTCGIEIRTRQVRTRTKPATPPLPPAAPQTSERVQRVPVLRRQGDNRLVN